MDANMDMKPQRLQLRRSAGFNLQAASRDLNGLPAKAVTRGTPWGNHYKVADYLKHHPEATKEEATAACVASFEAWLKESAEGRALAARAKKELRGFNLACYCGPQSDCHANVWLDILNE